MRTKSNCLESAIEVLEHRIAPATIVNVGANLAISDPEGNLLVETTATPGQIRVTDDSGAELFDGITGKLSITGRSAGSVPLDTISFLANASAFKGTLVINSGAGNDTVNLSGTINRSVTINTGSGDDILVFNDADVTVGKSFTINDPDGKTMLFDLNDRSLDVGASLSLFGITSFDMGAGNSLDVAKAMKITATPAATMGLTALFSGTETSVGGDLKITSGFGITDDVVSITSQVNISGNVSFKLGSGNNTIVLTPAAGGSGIAKAFTTNGLDGVDVVVFGADSVIGGKTNIVLGNGINTFVDTPTSKYGKNLSISGGFNTNTCVITGQIEGNLSIAMAAGGAGDTTVFTGTVGDGKKIKYRNGDDGTLEVLTLAPVTAAVLNVDVKFGNGDSTFNLGPNVSLTGKVVGQGGTYTFNQGTAILLPGAKLINYP